jgi:hypothetical protein
MRLEYDDETKRVIDVWLERFGEPPAIMADLDLMWSVLNSTPSGKQEEAAVG